MCRVGGSGYRCPVPCVVHMVGKAHLSPPAALLRLRLVRAGLVARQGRVVMQHEDGVVGHLAVASRDMSSCSMGMAW